MKRLEPPAQEGEQVMPHQPAISFSISSQQPFNRAGGRTSNVLQEMESRTGAGLIAGMFQGTKHINPLWDSLPEATVEEFVRTWTHELDNWTAGSTDAIIESITLHDALRDAWCLLDERSREARRQVIETIAANVRNEEAESGHRE